MPPVDQPTASTDSSEASAVEAPRGWQINPSDTRGRTATILLSLVGVVLSLVITLHAWGVTPRLWEPFPVVTDEGWVVHAPRAFAPELDVIGFSLIALFASLGGRDRWHRFPAVPVIMGAAVAVTTASIVTRWSWQYFTLGTTSTLFFLAMAAAISLLPIVADEVFASVLALAPREDSGASKPEVKPEVETLANEPESESWSGYVAGVGGIAVGLLILATPTEMLRQAAADHVHLVGAFIVAFGALALAQVARAARRVNIAIGVWLLVAPLLLGHAVKGTAYSMIMGLLLLVVSTLTLDRARGHVHEVYRTG